MTTIRDVAQAANVSISTVSHVINETRAVSPKTRARVLRAIEDLNYKHNRLASSLRQRKTQTIGVLLPNSTNPYFAEVLTGIEESCFEQNYNFIMGNANDNPQRELAYLQVLLSRQVDGIVLISTGAYVDSVNLLAANQTPVVMVDRSTDIETIDEIFTTNHAGGRLATEYLLRLGHTRIVCITGPSFLTPSAQRVDGYREALSTAGIIPDANWVIAGDFQMSSGYEATKTSLALSGPPTAIFACNDLMAVGALCAVHEVGLQVPQDISIIGYDDIPLASYTTPRLSTIAQPAREIGHLAVQRLLDRLQNPDKPPQHDMLPVTLVERDTCQRIKGEN